jgi:NAD(P)-dependent dehydrogenase (short-subunit alcohol dehydrogenase family)
MRLKNKVAVITGGAAGMGRGAVLKLAAEGAAVEILDLQDAGAVCDEIRKAGGTAHATQCDTTDEAALARCARAIEDRHGRIDILVNNAGILQARVPWHSVSRGEMNRFLQTNFMGYFLTTKEMYPLLKKSKAGRVINVASRTFFLANPGQMAYVAAKGAVWGMTRVLAKELGEENITVNAVAPGMIATPGTQAHSKEEAFDRVMQNQAIKKRGKPEHLANLIAFLASDEAEMITGPSMLADGGGSLH